MTTRVRSAEFLAGLAEALAGVEIIRGHAVTDHVSARLAAAVDSYRRAQRRAMRIAVTSFPAGELGVGLALAATVVAGTLLGSNGYLSPGTFVAFLFLVTFFTEPLQVAAEVLNEAQNAVAGWRRILDILDTPVAIRYPTDEEAVDSSGGPAWGTGRWCQLCLFRRARGSFRDPPGRPGDNPTGCRRGNG
jgi:putative ABC transport system ATP-binding protein